MQYSIAKDIFGSPWSISVQGLQQYMPVVNGMLNGAHFYEENEPRENMPFAMSDKGVRSEYGPQSDKPSSGNLVHVLPMRGVMMKHDMICGPAGTTTLAARLRNADADPDVAGHILLIEGPGGAANAIPVIADAIKAADKPVLAYVDGLMASAHMYAGSYADEIWASRDKDVIGSIGTMIVYQGRKQKSEEDSNKEIQVTIYADQSFDKNQEYEQAINNFDFKLAKENILNPHNEQFINDIKANRPNVEDNHLHGKVFNAADVVGTLIDNIGSFEDAVNRVFALAEENNAGSDGSQAINNHNQKVNSMDYPKIQSALGSDAFEVEADGRRTFTQEEMDAVENSLAENNSEELQGQLNEAQNTITERDNTIAELTEQVSNLQNSAGADDKKSTRETDKNASKEDDQLSVYASAKNTWDALEGIE